MRFAFTSLAAMLLLSPLARADEPVFSDAVFADKAAIGGHFEIASAKAALLKSRNPEVKKIAEELLKDHTMANEKLMGVAESRSIKLPKTLDIQHRELYAELEKHKGEAFDRHFLKEQITAHKKTIAMFEREVELGKDSDIKAFASDTLPKLREHAKHIETAAEALAWKK